MSNFARLSVQKLVLVTVGTLCAILLLIGGVLFFGLRTIEQDNQLQQSRALDKLALIDDTAQDAGEMQADILRQVLATDSEEIKQLDQKTHDVESVNAKELADYQKYIDSEKERRLYAQTMRARKKYWSETQPVLALSRVNHDDEATALINSKQAPAYDEFLSAINNLIQYVEADAANTTKATAHFIYLVRVGGDALVGLTILMVIGTAFSITTVGRRLKEDNLVLEAEIKVRKRAEEELRWKTAFLEAQVNSSPDGILVVDQDKKTALQNQRFIDLFKIPRHLAGEKTDERRLRWATDMVKNPEQFVEQVKHLYAHPDEVSREEVELKDGTVLDRYSSPVLGGDGTHYGRIWTFRDISDRKRFEAKLLQSQKMETVGKLAGGIAHEFNSILTAIIGQSEILLDRVPPESPLAENANEIIQSAERAATLTRQLLAYGRKQILQPEILDLDRIIGNMESLFHNFMGRDVQIQIISAPGLKAVKADAGQIEQVITNISMNARDAMPNGGKLTLETCNVSFDEETVGQYSELKPGNYVMLAITDTGIGMTPEVTARAFEPFFSTKAVGQGTGLGLSTSYGIIKQSGGHISIYSETGRGTTVKVFLPQLNQPTAAATPRVHTDDLPGGTETILLVEDDPGLRTMAQTLLKRLGYTVHTAANGVEALNLKQQRNVGHIDLLFTDVVMPHMSGKELADRVRSLYPHTRILFTSAYAENAIVHQGVLDEGVTLLQKPFKAGALAHKLREVLDK